MGDYGDEDPWACPTWAQRGPVRLAARRSAASELLSVSQGDLKQFLRISKSKDESLKPQPLTTKHKVIAQLGKRLWGLGTPEEGGQWLTSPLGVRCLSARRWPWAWSIFPTAGSCTGIWQPGTAWSVPSGRSRSHP